MADKQDKWLMFKNYLHNELNITKEDIREWLEDACRQEAKKIIDNSFKQFDLRRIAKELIREELQNIYKDYKFKEKIVDKVLSCIKIDIPE